MNILDLTSVTVGDELPALEIVLTRTAIVAGAMATRDWQDVHHDHERARASGLKDIILSIPTTSGYVARFITQWAGPASALKSNGVKLGGPAYPGDSLRFTGQVAEIRDHGVVVVRFSATTASSVHASGQAVVAMSGSEESQR